MQIDLTQIIIAFFGLISAIVTAVVVPYIKQKLTNEQLVEMKKWAIVAVEAAEQIFTGTGRGVEKKEYVLSFLEEKGLKVDAVSIDNLIEASVLELKKAISE